MKIEDIDFADGQVGWMRSDARSLAVSFTDWRECTWLLRFVDVLMFENVGIEGSDLDGMQVRTSDPCIERVCRIHEEPRDSFLMFEFREASSEEIRLRIVARSCSVARGPEKW